jgi:hypothetical protein
VEDASEIAPILAHVKRVIEAEEVEEDNELVHAGSGEQPLTVQDKDLPPSLEKKSPPLRQTFPYKQKLQSWQVQKNCFYFQDVNSLRPSNKDLDISDSFFYIDCVIFGFAMALPWICQNLA